MKTITLLFSAFLFIPVLSGQVKPAETTKSGRIEKIINSQWTFNYYPDESSDKGYEAVGYNDSRWAAISLPHSWMTYETTGELHPFIMNPSEEDNPYWWKGWGWYRKHFSVNGDIINRKIFIEFEGVQKYCKVWINGIYLGDHKGGYSSFDFDITGYIRPGEDNVLAVAVNNRQNDIFRTPPMTPGDFNVYGGIYRDVTIVVKSKIYIPMQGSSSHEGGTFVTTPKVTEQDGSVRVMTWVQNDYPEQKKCMLSTTITDGSGKTVLTMKKEATINPGRIFVFDQSGRIKNPSLWSPEDPYLYSVNSEVISGTEVLDSYKSPLGFRWFRWDTTENYLYLNGKKIVLHGGSRQQEFPWLGDAIPKWITLMDFLDMSEKMNFNFLRTSHYPNDKLVYDLADKYGVVIVEESPSIKDQDFSPEIQEQQTREMIRRDRNHPSILFWSVGDNTDHAVDSKYAIAEDTTRIITAGKVTNESAGDFITQTDFNNSMENLTWSAVRGWYNSDVKDVSPSDGGQCGTEEQQQNLLKASGRFGKGNLFTGIYHDHGSDKKNLNSPIFNVSTDGYVDIYRIPKYAYYFWQASWYDKPMIFIQPPFWRSPYIGQQKDIVVNSNCEKVELKVNGINKGILFPSDSNFHTVTFKDISVEDAVLTAEGTMKGIPVSATYAMAGPSARIVLTSSHKGIPADRGCVAVITADILDADGNHVYGASNTIKWSVNGPAKPAGPSVYESDIDKHHGSEGVWYIDSPVSNIIRSTGKPGKITVQASSGGLISGYVEIEAIDPKPDNSVISEPVLSESGRRPVTRVMLKAERLDNTRQEIKPVKEEFIASASGKENYEGVIRNQILKENSAIDTTTIEFRTLAGILAGYLKNNNGRLSAADFNFNVGNFNNCRLITGYLSTLKLPRLFTDGLRKYYSDKIIRESVDKDAGDEMNWLNWIPSGGTVIISQDASEREIVKGAVMTDKRDLADIINVVHPSFAGFSPEGKERAISFISRMNPYVKVYTISEKVGTGDGSEDGTITTKVVYTVEAHRPILIPLLKFIAE
jgi:beta-galactosidase